VTHIDPFAPADSPQHPANHGLRPEPPTEADRVPYESEDFTDLMDASWWDHESGSLKEYADLFNAHATDEERARRDAGEGGEPDFGDLRARGELEAATQEESPADPEESQRLHLASHYREEGDDTNAPSVAKLRARATLARPGSSANKAEWVQYALTIRHELAPEDAEALTVAVLRELKP
jgi:hypothetical protein